MKWISFFITLISIVNTQAQDSLAYLAYSRDPNYVVGYVVDNAGNKVEGLMLKYQSVSSRVLLILSNGEEKKYRAKDMKNFKMGSEKYASDGNFIYRLIYEGKLELYEMAGYSHGVSFSGTGGGTITTPGSELLISYFHKADSNKFQRISKASFKKDLPNFFSDCEILSSKIKKGELTIDDIDLIRYIYNNDCKE